MQTQNNNSFAEFESFEQFFAQAEQRSGFWIERAQLEFTEKVLTRMKEIGVSRSDLASNLGVHRGMITKLLNGKNNFELATMVRIARALKCGFRSHLEPEGTKACWINVLTEEPRRETIKKWNPGEFHRINFIRMNSSEYEAEPVAT